ncbi:MAG TPA: T9SS type A sorting domain-containing protein [Saprospiraceae bacterium]|nr:T9SS type A sorting domain-containing protein [Saprospiraceae bacterium]
MKKMYLFFILLIVSALSNAQTNRYSVTPSPCVHEFTFDPNEPDQACHSKVKNNTNTTINILWAKENLMLPETWTAYVCDANSCYSYLANKSPENNPNVIKPGDVASIDVHVNADSQDGAHIVMWIYEREDTTKKLKVDYLFNKTVGVKDSRVISMKVYPNPAQNSISLEYNTGVKSIEIISLLGKRLASYQTSQNRSYDISQLEDGLYLLKIIGEKNELLKTLRIEKRAVRP